MYEESADERKKHMSVGIHMSCPPNISGTTEGIFAHGFQFLVTQLTHPNYTRLLKKGKFPACIGRTDRVLRSTEWTRLIVAELSPHIDVDSEVDHIRTSSRDLLLQELGYAAHLGVPAILISLIKPNNIELARILNDKLNSGFNFSIWVTIPLVHPSKHSPLAETEHDAWDWWNDFRTYCGYDRRLGVVLELPEVAHVVSRSEIQRWIGEPVKAILIPTRLFLINGHGNPVLSRVHQDVIKRFMSIDVQYIIKKDTDDEYSPYVRYLQYLGKKLDYDDSVTDFIQGCEDFLQNPLQPLSEHLESNIYEVFEKDQIKYDTYQNAVYKAIEAFPKENDSVPVVMVVGAGRGPLVQAVLNVSMIQNRKVKVYAVEKNPYAINTLIDRVKNEWNNEVTIINEDMRTYEPPEKADILVSELLGSFGDNELSPECLDGAQRFLKKTGISIPCSYTSYLAPVQSIKLYNEIKATRPYDKSLLSCYETPYVVHLVNYFEIASPLKLFTFTHPNWSERINNQRYKKLKFKCSKTCVLTGFAGFFETNLYKDIDLSIHPQTHTPDMVSWFPIYFSLPEPVHVTEDTAIEVSFWRAESEDKVWYEWCLEAPIKGSIMNPSGRSYSIKKH